MVLTETFASMLRLIADCCRSQRWRDKTSVAMCLVVFLQPAWATDESLPEDSPATQAVREQLEQETAEQLSAANERRLRSDAASTVQKNIEQLKADLNGAVQQRTIHQEALKLAESRESIAAKAVAELVPQLKNHRAADALQASADVALSRLEDRRAEVVQSNQQLADLHNESFGADQAARRADREAAAIAKQADTTQQMLPKASQAVIDAEIALVDARAQSIEASRRLADQSRMLNQALTDAAGAQDSVARLTNTAASIESSITALGQVAAVSAGSTEDQVDQLRTVLQQIIPLQTVARQMLDARLAAVEERRVQQNEAAGVAAAAESNRRMKADAHSVLSRKHFALQREVLTLVAASQERRKTGTKFTAKKDELGLVITQMQEQSAELELAVAGLHTVWVDLQKQVEQALEPLGRFVSFSHEIAPILARRCTACHNTRTTGGRLNLNSFAALLKGGESGAVLTPHDPDDSLLLMMVQDASMPKDADPLTTDEIQTIHRWVAVGAPLDAGTAATDDLFDIMPERPQPLPPATYRVPIPVLATAFSPDGSLLATSGYHEVLLWGNDGALVRRITNVAQRVNDLEFTADGTTLVVAAGTPGQLGEVKLFRVADGGHLGTLVRTTDSVYSVSVSPDGTRLATGGADQRIVILDMETGSILRTIEDHADSVMDVAWSPLSDRIASASYDKSCRVFDVATGEVLKTFTQHGEPVYTVAFSADGKSIVSGGADRKLRVWPVADGDQIREIGGFEDHVFRLVVTVDGRVYSAGADRQIREHQLSDGELLRTMSGHTDWVYALAVDAEGSQLATGCYDGEVRRWNLADGTVASSFVAVPEQDTAPMTVSGR
ncbi:MAG: c-type cytochrome domain-containing protein [Planctomycetaceae bacterium]